MRNLTVRGACLTLAILLAGAGLLPCACAEMKAADSASSHCGRAESGLRPADDCGCACMRAAAAEPDVLPFELAPNLAWRPGPPPAAVRASRVASDPAVPDGPGESHSPSPQPILRV
jgi:hypothetical protein